MPTLITVCGFIIAAGFLFKIYNKLSTGWCKSQTCLIGKTAIITGANTGIGFETALDFAKRGARVILACRNEVRAEHARERIIDLTGNENVVVKLVDMASFRSVRDFAEDVIATEDRLDILVNNAGVMGFHEKKSEDGYLLGIQVNHYSSFLLTNLLIGLMRKSQSARIVNVSSLAAALVNLDLKKLNTYSSDNEIYAVSKLCNILFTMELAKKLDGTNITTFSVHPGIVQTDLFRRRRDLPLLLYWFAVNAFFKTKEEGAQSIIYCAVAKGLEKFNGEHFSDCQRVGPYKSALVPGLSAKLWEITEKAVQLKPEEAQYNTYVTK